MNNGGGKLQCCQCVRLCYILGCNGSVACCFVVLYLFMLLSLVGRLVLTLDYKLNISWCRAIQCCDVVWCDFFCGVVFFFWGGDTNEREDLFSLFITLTASFSFNPALHLGSAHLRILNVVVVIWAIIWYAFLCKSKIFYPHAAKSLAYRWAKQRTTHTKTVLDLPVFCSNNLRQTWSNLCSFLLGYVHTQRLEQQT